MEQATVEPERPKDRPFNPSLRASTDNGRALVAEVVRQCLEHEAINSLRQRARRQCDRRMFDLQVEAITSDLAHQHLMRPDQRVSITRSKAILGHMTRYGSSILGKTLPSVIDLLGAPALGFIDELRGSRYDFEGEGVKQTTIAADSGLIRLLDRFCVTTEDFRQTHDGEVIILKDRAASIHDKAERMDYVDTDTTNCYRCELRSINRWLADADIDFDPNHSTRPVDTGDRLLRRIFSNGSFEEGGRLWGGFWQQLSKQQRRKGLYVDGGETVTLDFGQTAIRILYGMAGVEPAFNDAYHLPQMNGKHREGVKKVFNALLCADKPLSRFPAGIRELINDRGVRMHDITSAITAAHAPIASMLHAGYGLKVMFRESQILVAILLQLKERGITALPIHDALVVSHEHTDTTRAIMEKTFKDIAGVDSPVSIDHGD